MSGNTRVGLPSARFSPGDGISRVPSSVTSAAVPKTRKSGPVVLVFSASLVPSSSPKSACSHR